jgi:anthranilate synthase component 1
LQVLRATHRGCCTRPATCTGRGDLPPLTGGIVGYLGYDVVRRLEKLAESSPRTTSSLPELTMLLAADLAVLDHASGTVILIANAINHDGTADGVDAAYRGAVARLDAMAADLARPHLLPPATLDLDLRPEFTANRTSEDFRAAVDSAKEEIRAGEAFQIVLSQRFEMATQASALDVYRVLRATNPSPYMYLFRFPSERGAFDVVGSSPEALVKISDGEAMLHPIAGTRPRGKTPAEDAALAEELMGDPKERAEHLMLVDLGRNDVGRVAKTGEVKVTDSFFIERYSHVMHLVSNVEGKIRSGLDAVDALSAGLPAGTLSGAPKIRAMQIIDEFEPTRRGVYGGCVGYLDFAGNSDTAIAIRTALLRDGVAYVQAGAGIVADSVPESEDAECRNKAMAVLRAVAAAGTLRPAG